MIGKVIGVVALGVVAAATASAVVSTRTASQGDVTMPFEANASASPSHSAREHHVPATHHYVGVAVARQSDLGTFISATGVRPDIVQIYERFGTPFPAGWAADTVASGRLPMIQINPFGNSLADIAAGHYDSYLRSYAAAARKAGGRVGLSFGHEMNGRWYPWGCRHTAAAVYIAAWRRIVDVIRNSGAHNVIWVWTANVQAQGDCPLAARYPGNNYVTWVGIDGYLRRPGTTFTGNFGNSLAQCRQFARKPILLAETGVLIGQPGDASRIRDLYHGASVAQGVIGIVYFDAQTSKYGDYRPQDSAATLAAFRKAVARYRRT